MNYSIAVLPGDGIGPEVTTAALSALAAVGDRFGHRFECETALIGGAAIDDGGSPFPALTREVCLDTDAVLLGAVGGPKWSDPAAAVRPEQGLLDLRALLGVYANLRPIAPLPALYSSSPLREERLHGVDFIVVRELTGGIYFGDKTRDADSASDLCRYSRDEIARITRVAAELAAARGSKIVSVDKANVLETSRLWREVLVDTLSSEFPDIRFEHMLVDAAAMHLIARPADFDVIVTENMFGDILTDEASMLCGSLGMLPSASLGSDGRGLYEPIHGSAPDIAGQGVANPCGTIASVALMLRHSFGLEAEAAALEAAIAAAIDGGVRTADIAGSAQSTSTAAMTTAIVEQLLDG